MYTHSSKHQGLAAASPTRLYPSPRPSPLRARPLTQANAALDQHIAAIAGFESELAIYLALLAQAAHTCAVTGEAALQCGGYVSDQGCGYRCLDKICEVQGIWGGGAGPMNRSANVEVAVPVVPSHSQGSGAGHSANRSSNAEVTVPAIPSHSQGGSAGPPANRSADAEFAGAVQPSPPLSLPCIKHGHMRIGCGSSLEAFTQLGCPFVDVVLAGEREVAGATIIGAYASVQACRRSSTLIVRLLIHAA